MIYVTDIRKQSFIPHLISVKIIYTTRNKCVDSIYILEYINMVCIHTGIYKYEISMRLEMSCMTKLHFQPLIFYKSTLMTGFTE